MMIKLTTLCAGFLLLLGSSAIAQDAKPALQAAPENPASENTLAVEPELTETEPLQVKAPALPRLSYQMEMGAMVGSGQFGYSATYLRPTAYYNINNRFRAFTSLTYLNVNSLGNSFSEGRSGQPFGSQHYILQAGGQYLYSDNLTLTGSVWKDFSQAGNMNGNLYTPNRQGMSFRADYKVNERMTISGGVRYSNGYNPNPYNGLFSQPFDPVGY